MQRINLEIEKLVGYALVDADDGKRVKKLGSTKLGCKGGGMGAGVSSDELAASADRLAADA
jgi:hypothetical protein